jgi:hypothetical protein
MFINVPFLFSKAFPSETFMAQWPTMGEHPLKISDGFNKILLSF